MAQRETRLTLERYLEFYEGPWRSHLSRPLLNQIVYIHGFVKLYDKHKITILRCLESVDLMPPARSTLAEGVSPAAALTADEAAEDLAALGWRECSVRSVRALGSGAEDHLVAGEGFPFVAGSSTSSHLPRPRGGRGRGRAPPADFVIRGRRPRSKRKRVSIKALTAADAFSVSSAGEPSTPHSPSSPPPPTPPPPSSPPSCTPPPPSSSPPCTPPNPSSSPPCTPPPPSSPPPCTPSSTHPLTPP